MKNIETEIVIDAKPDVVWQTLMKTDEYEEWNPFVRKLEGNIEKGSQIEITLKQLNGKEIGLKPTVTELIPNKEFRWQGKLFIKGVFDAEHYFKLESKDNNKTKFIHGENFGAVLMPFMGGVLKSTEEGFKAMNEELKVRCERG